MIKLKNLILYTGLVSLTNLVFYGQSQTFFMQELGVQLVKL
jgi:hypothetical protein